MGVGGGFWDVLKPYATREGPDAFREKRVAIDLFFWIIQQETAVSSPSVRKPHLRLSFFRVINLFSKYGAYPIFVIDGTSSPLKSRSRISRFDSPTPQPSVPVERNRAFAKRVEECVEMMELLGMPVLRAKGEGEALCAQLNREGYVDACVTSDSDAFLFGARCVVKSITRGTKEPFEVYYMSDIEKGLGLKRNHLIAMSLLVGNDHCLSGLPGIGVDSALRFVKMHTDEDVLKKMLMFSDGESSENLLPVCSPSSKPSHCSFCGHLGTRKGHLNRSCEECASNATGCLEKPSDFECSCSYCEEHRRRKAANRMNSLKLKICDKIRMEGNFPIKEIIEMYMSENNGSCTELTWRKPRVDSLADFLAFHEIFKPSEVRRKMFPMMTTMHLRRVAAMEIVDPIYNQFKFNSIKRMSIRYGEELLMIAWRKVAPIAVNSMEVIDVEEYYEEDNADSVREMEEMKIFGEEDGCFLLTAENLELVKRAYPEKVLEFFSKREEKDSNKKKREKGKCEKRQPQISDFFRSTKGKREGECEGVSKKSVRRRLAFD